MPIRHVFFVLIVVVLWGANFVVLAVGLHNFPPYLLAAVRFTAVVFPAIFLVRIPRGAFKPILAIGAFTMFGQFALLYWAMNAGMPAKLAPLIVQAQAPFGVLLAAVFLREQPTRRQIIGVVVGLLGLAIVATGRSTGTTVTGIALTVAASMSWAIGNVFNRHIRDVGGLSIVVWTSAVAVVPMWALAFAASGPRGVYQALTHMSTTVVWSTAYTVVCSTLIAYGLWTWLLTQHHSVQLAPFSLLIPVVGIACAWLFLGQRLNLTETIGSAVVIGAVGLGVLKGRTRPVVEIGEPVVAEAAHTEARLDGPPTGETATVGCPGDHPGCNETSISPRRVPGHI